jgi:hypothetical protein
VTGGRGTAITRREPRDCALCVTREGEDGIGGVPKHQARREAQHSATREIPSWCWASSSAKCRPRKQVDDPANRTEAGLAFADRPGKDAFHCLKVGDLCADIRHMRRREALRFGARGCPTPWRQSQQFTNILQGEAELARSANEVQPGHIVGSIAPKPAALAPRLRQQANPLVVADGLDRAVAVSRELAYRDVGFRCQIAAAKSIYRMSCPR